MSLAELIDQARYGSANGYDNLDMLRESLTKAEKQALLEVIEEEFENMRDDIVDALYKVDCTIHFEKDAEPITMQVIEKLGVLYNDMLEVLKEEEDYLNARLKGRER